MASFWILVIAAASNVVLASTTSRLEGSLATTKTSTHGSTHNTTQAPQVSNSTWMPLQGTHVSMRVSPNQSSSIASLLPHLPWTGNASRTARPTETNALAIGPRTTVTVGKGGELIFEPSTLNVAPGSIVAFNFLSLNHTLTESELEDPCRSNGGFDTGFAQFNPANISGHFVVEYKVADVSPRWFFCAQNFKRPHCQAGMVFSLNPAGRQMQFLSNALAAVTPTPVQTASACRPIASVSVSSNLSIVFQSSGTVSSGLGSSSTAISPLISNMGSSNGVHGLGIGIVLALAML